MHGDQYLHLVHRLVVLLSGVHSAWQLADVHPGLNLDTAPPASPMALRAQAASARSRCGGLVSSLQLARVMARSHFPWNRAGVEWLLLHVPHGRRTHALRARQRGAPGGWRGRQDGCHGPDVRRGLAPHVPLTCGASFRHFGRWPGFGARSTIGALPCVLRVPHNSSTGRAV